jgi:NADP-dependent 3-hydroxy acid dehydrogenase YdfG
MERKVAYITGGTKGIGLGIAKALLDSGYKVAISGRNLTQAEQAAVTLAGELYQESVLPIQSDVGVADSERAAIARIIDQWDRLDVVVANAGVGIFKPIDELSADDWNQMMNTNLTGVFHTCSAAIPTLKESRGYIFTIGSLAGVNFFAKGAGYNATKYGIVGFSQAMMLDLRPYGIKVTTIMPGSVSSFFNANIPSEADQWKIQPEDIGQLIIDLLAMPARTLPSKIEVRPAQPQQIKWP